MTGPCLVKMCGPHTFSYINVQVLTTNLAQKLYAVMLLCEFGTFIKAREYRTAPSEFNVGLKTVR